MANEIYWSFGEEYTLYALIWRKTDDKVWNNTDETWDTYTDADIDKYDVVLTNHVDSDYHSVDFPAAITTAGVYRVQVVWQVGGGIDADLDIVVANGELHWDGSAEIDLTAINNDQNIVTNVYDETEGVSGGQSLTSTGVLTQESGDC